MAVVLVFISNYLRNTYTAFLYIHTAAYMKLTLYIVSAFFITICNQMLEKNVACSDVLII